MILACPPFEPLLLLSGSHCAAGFEAFVWRVVLVYSPHKSTAEGSMNHSPTSMILATHYSILRITMRNYHNHQQHAIAGGTACM